MQRVLLIRPDLVGTPYAMRKFRIQHQPLGLLALAASALEVPGIDVRIADEIVGDDPFAMIDSYRPDCVGISVASPLYRRCCTIACYAKERGAKVLFGGPHCSAMPEQSLRDSCADAVAFGEADQTFPRLLTESTWSEIPGICYREGDDIKKNPPAPLVQDLDALPRPPRHLLDQRKYRKDAEFGLHVPFGYRMIRLFASRGCSYLCSFCARSAVFTRNVRFRSPESVKEEILSYQRDYACKSIVFMDDTFTESEEHCMGIAEMLLRNDIKITWSCFSRVGLRREVVKTLHRAGCRMMEFGIESGSERLLESVRKQTCLPDIVETYRYTREVGIKTKAFFIVGLPGETDEDFQASVKLAKKVNPNYVLITAFAPLPGSDLFDSREWNIEGLFGTSWFYPDDPVVRQRYHKFLRGYYLRPAYAFLFLRSTSLAELYYFVNMALGHFVRSRG